MEANAGLSPGFRFVDLLDRYVNGMIQLHRAETAYEREYWSVKTDQTRTVIGELVNEIGGLRG